MDYWRQRLTGRDAPEGGGRGRVLRAKLGYNPNSSSVGSVVSVLMWSAAFSAIALNSLEAVLRRQAADGSGSDERDGDE